MPCLLLFFAFAVRAGAAQQLTVGIAPTFDAGSDESGPAVVQHLALNIYNDLLKSGAYQPELLGPGGVYSPFDTSWLLDYVHDRQDLDLLLLATLKPNGKGGVLVVDVGLLNAHTGEAISSWTATSDVSTKKGMFKALGTTIRAESGIASSRGFSMSSLGQATSRVADSVRDLLPTRAAGVKAAVSTPTVPAPATSAPPRLCLMHTRITYAYKHAVSRSHLLQVNDLDQTSTVNDGVSLFQLAEGPTVLQFTLNDAPYTMSKQPLCQWSTVHSCEKSTVIIDLGKQGDAHLHWE